MKGTCAGEEMEQGRGPGGGAAGGGAEGGGSGYGSCQVGLVTGEQRENVGPGRIMFARRARGYDGDTESPDGGTGPGARTGEWG